MAMNNWQILFLVAAVCFAGIALLKLRDQPENTELARYFLLSLIAMLFVTLTACSTPAVKEKIVEVRVPVAVQPIKPADVPTPPAPLPPRPGSLSAAADVLLSKWCAAVGYMLKADPLLRVSAGVPQKPLEHYPECER
jgi:hypothetical protein